MNPNKRGVQGGTFGRLFAVSLLGLVVTLGLACQRTDVVVTPTQISDDHSGNGPQASPSPTACEPDGIVLGTAGDEFEFDADGEDFVVLVPSFYLGLIELPAACAGRVVATFEVEAGACTVDGTRVTSAVVGQCSIAARRGTLRSNAIKVRAK